MTPEIEAAREIVRSGLYPQVKAAMTDKERDVLSNVFAVAQAQLSHLKFMKWCWGRKRPMMIGIHTWYMCKQIDIAFEDFRNGISTFLINLVCFRHGKSEVTTRYLPAHFMAEFTDREVIVTSHSTKNTHKFSRFGRNLIRSKAFQQLYPHVSLSKENAGIEEWGLEGTEALAQFFGISAGISGVGGGLIVTDDYFGKREEAESALVRDKIYDAYTDNIFTRRDDPSINLITVTPWHSDDLAGRLIKNMRSSKNATQYKVVRIPYKEPSKNLIREIGELLEQETDVELREDVKQQLDEYSKGAYLFERRYSRRWYRDMESSLGGEGGYGTASLMRCNPRAKTGATFKTENTKYLKAAEFAEKTKGLTFVRAWDLASTIKQKVKSDPDYTVGVLLAVRWLPTKISGVHAAEVFIKDVVRGRWEATQRKEKILQVAIADGLIRVGIEAFGQYKDAYDELKAILRGVRVITKMKLPGDKLIKASVLEPVFDAGNFYVLEAHWNREYIDEFADFPGGAHDDQVDATAVATGMNKPVSIGFQYDEQYIL